MKMLVLLLLALLLHGVVLSQFSAHTTVAAARLHVRETELQRSLARYRMLLQHEDSRGDSVKSEKLETSPDQDSQNETKAKTDSAVENPETKKADESQAGNSKLEVQQDSDDVKSETIKEHKEDQQPQSDDPNKANDEQKQNSNKAADSEKGQSQEQQQDSVKTEEPNPTPENHDKVIEKRTVAADEVKIKEKNQEEEPKAEKVDPASQEGDHTLHAKEQHVKDEQQNEGEAQKKKSEPPSNADQNTNQQQVEIREEPQSYDQNTQQQEVKQETKAKSESTKEEHQTKMEEETKAKSESTKEEHQTKMEEETKAKSESTKEEHQTKMEEETKAKSELTKEEHQTKMEEETKAKSESTKEEHQTKKEEEEAESKTEGDSKHEEDSKEKPFEFPEPYLLGPPIKDWDEQRQGWLNSNPDMKTNSDGKPRVLIVTGSQPNPCRSPVGDHFHLKSLKIKIDYARMHNYEIYYNFAWLDPLFNSYWVKLPIVRKLMLTHPEIEWFFWIDSDAVFTDMLFEAPFDSYDKEGMNMVMWGFHKGFYKEKSWVSFNAGVFMIRNCQWSLDLIDKWSPMGPEGPVRNEYGKILTEFLSYRIPNYPADDQSALAYLILTDETINSKVKLVELVEYMISGWWVEVVDNYETSMEKYHPGLGDRRWPWITHFTGCGPCGGDGNNENYQKCMKNIERALNFADNQVLAFMGFQHESLSSDSVLRTRNETVKPLEFVGVNPWAEKMARVKKAAAA
ncbi:unnamed protein product [Calypogeia fissa]